MKKIIALAAFLLTLNLSSQTLFQNIYSHDSTSMGFVNAMQATADGGYILAGSDSSSSSQDRDVYLLKTNSNGDTMWAKSYGTTGFEYGLFVVQCNDGGYLAVGTSLSTDFNVYLVRTDSNGDTLWTRIVGGNMDDEANSVQLTHGGGFIICGYTNSYGAGNFDYFLMKLDANGNTLWSHTYGTLADELGYYAEETTDKGFIVCGAAAAPNASLDAYVIKTDSMGVVQWSNYYGTLQDEWAYMIKEVSGGGYILTGYSPDLSSTTDALMIRTDNLGDTLWTRSYGGSSWEQGLYVMETNDKGFAMAGSVYSNSMGGSDAMLLRTDSAGNFIFCRGIGGVGNDWSFGIAQTNDSGYVVGAYSNSFTPGRHNYYLIRTDAAGRTLNNCNVTFITLQNTHLPLVKSAASTQRLALIFPQVYYPTNVDSGMMQIDPCPSLATAQFTSSQFSLSVYPNPGSGVYHLNATNESNCEITIFDALGNVVYKKSIAPNEAIDLKSLRSGVYYVRVKIGNAVYNSRIIHQP